MIVRVVYREPFERLPDHDVTEDGKVYAFQKTRMREEFIECDSWGMSGNTLAIQKDINDNGDEEGRLMLSDMKTWFILSALTAEEVTPECDGEKIITYKGLVSGKIYQA